MIKLIKSNYYNEKDTSRKLSKFIQEAEQLSFGEQCVSFENNFAKFQGRKNCIFVNSGSSANLALIQSLINLKILNHGDKVGFSALTWSTNVMPLIELGLEAVPIDVEISTLNISSRTVKECLLGNKLKAIFITNLLGWCDDIDVISHICKQSNIVLIEDNCESLGSMYKGKKLGNFGVASTFSFYVGHHMSTIEGGAVCTNNEKLSTMLKLVRAHGWDRNLTTDRQDRIRRRYKVNSTFYSRYTFYDLGYNLRPTEINGFLGNNQLNYINEIIHRRSDNYHKLSSKIYDLENQYYYVKSDHMDLLSNFAIPIICKTKGLRDRLVEKCADLLEIRPIVGGDMTQQPFFTKHTKHTAKKYKLPNSSLIHSQGLYFGNNPELTSLEIAKIIEIFTKDI